MRRQAPVFAGTALVAMLAAQSAAAALTAEQVWDDLQSLAGRVGQTLDGTPRREGDSLVIDPARLRAGDETTDISARIEDLRLTQRDDGTVAISVAPRYPLKVTTAPPDGPPVEMHFTLRQPDLAVIASGAPDDVDYAIDAPKIAIALDSVTRGGEPVDTDFSANLHEVDGTYAFQAGEPARLGIDLAAQEVETSGHVVPEEGGTMDFSLNLDDVDAGSTSKLADAAGTADLAAMLDAGFTSQGTISYGAGRYKASSRDSEGREQSVNATLDGGSLDVELGGKALSYASTNSSVEATLAGFGLPVEEATISLDESELELAMPIAPTDEAENFDMLLRLAGLNLGEELWSALDPTSALPHTPARLTLDLTGAGRWTVNPFDLESGQDEESPGKLRGIELESLMLSAVGAELTGEGDFTFADSGEGFDGLPPASGTAEFRLAGFEALLDDLVKMGTITREKATGARMMIGLLAEKGDTPDTLVSRIEVEKDGTIRANGQRLR